MAPISTQTIQAPITTINCTCKFENFTEANKAYLGYSLVMSNDRLGIFFEVERQGASEKSCMHTICDISRKLRPNSIGIFPLLFNCLFHVSEAGFPGST